jgi:hypothetical protein
MSTRNHNSRAFHESRRRFLRQTLQTAATLTAAVNGISAKRAYSASTLSPTRRRHHINIVMGGGWDSNWFHNGIPMNAVQPLVTDPTYGKDTYVTPASQFDNSAGVATQPIVYSQHHPDNEGMPHPNQPDQFLGSGMAMIFSAADLMNMCIWKGISAAPEHGINNTIQLGGLNSQYAIYYPSLIAEGIAEQDYTRPLHMVDVSATPLVNINMCTGWQIPICIGGLQAFQAMTGSNPNEPASNVGALINASINRLGSTLSSSRFKMKAGADLYSSFLAGYNGLVSVAGSGLGASNYLAAVRRYYTLCIVNQLYNMWNGSYSSYQWSQMTTGKFFSGLSGEALEYKACHAPSMVADFNTFYGLLGDTDTTALAAYIAGCTVNDALPPGQQAAAQAALDASSSGVISHLGDVPAILAKIAAGTVATASSPHIAVGIDGIATSYAMADFLVRKDISAVVDIAPGMGWQATDIGIPRGDDCHNSVLPHSIHMAIVLTGYRTLMRSLAAVPLHGPGNQGSASNAGASILDVTSITMTTDFDRQPSYSGDGVAAVTPPGNGHWSTASVVMAGGLVRGGTVVGAVRTGLESSASGTGFGSPVNGPSPFAYALPIDSTGRKSPSGTIIGCGALFPTMLSMYGVAVPLRQTTESVAFPAVIKGS